MEKHALRGLVRGSTDESDDEELSFAERALKRARLSTVYVLVNAVAPTSNIAERLFSHTRSIIGPQRHGLQPIMLESILFLKLNRSYWNAQLVRDAIHGDED